MSELASSHGKPASPRRQAIMYGAWWGYLHRDEMHYTNDNRRYEDQNPPPNFPAATDCSGFAHWCYVSCAKAPDPGWGTGLMQSHGKTVPPAMVRYGDLVFFGDVFQLNGHVGIVVGHDWMIDFGSEVGPLHRRISLFIRDVKPFHSYRTYPMR